MGIIPYPLCTVDPNTDQLSGCEDSGGIELKSPQAMTLNTAGAWAYITNLADRDIVSLYIVDSNTGKLSGCADSGASNIFDGSYGIAFNGAETLACVTSYFSNKVTLCVVNPGTGKLSNCVDSCIFRWKRTLILVLVEHRFRNDSSGDSSCTRTVAQVGTDCYL
jgi:hypothetical protein